MKGFTHHPLKLAAALLARLAIVCGLMSGSVVTAWAGVSSAPALPPVALVHTDGKPGSLDVIPVPAAQIEAQVLDLTRQVAQRVSRGSSASAANPASPSVNRLEVSLGSADARLRLAPCDKVQAYVPDGVNLWGRSRVGLRCEQGAVHWNVYVPVTVRVFGAGVVPAVNLPLGARIEAADLRVAEVDLAAEGSPAILSVDEAAGRLVARSVQAGQSLRQGHLKAKRYFAVGDPVRLIVKGSGFSVSGTGEALTPGDEGQCARIRTEAGRIVCGRPVGERAVELSL